MRDRLSGDYSLGPTITRLAQSALRQTSEGDLVLSASRYMRELREATGETVGFHVIQSLRRLCISELPSHLPIRYASGVGSTYPLGVGAAGKLLLAHAPNSVIERVVQLPEFQASSHIGIDLAAVHQSLDRIREIGYTMSSGETVPGAAAVAVPILDASDTIRAAINVTGPANRWTEERMLQHLPEIKDLTEWLERMLGRETAARSQLESSPVTS